MPAWVNEGYNDYARRMPAESRLLLREIAPARRGRSGSPGRWMAEEAERITAAIPRGSEVVALAVEGRSWSTQQLADQLRGWLAGGRDIALIIGGADGIDPALIARADRLWSLSPLTLPHPLVRIIVAEQLYRASTLLQGHPYHRGS
jgi:23S rRNA (pseudouridine1915-N3)-methyltransferase